eukprot:5731815-Prymnesium_polylepis.1
MYLERQRYLQLRGEKRALSHGLRNIIERDARAERVAVRDQRTSVRSVPAVYFEMSYLLRRTRASGCEWCTSVPFDSLRDVRETCLQKLTAIHKRSAEASQLIAYNICPHRDSNAGQLAST